MTIAKTIVAAAAAIFACTACDKEYEWKIPDSLDQTEWTFFDKKNNASMVFDGNTCNIKLYDYEDKTLISEGTFEYVWRKPDLTLTATDDSGATFEAYADTDHKSYVVLYIKDAETADWDFPTTYHLIGEYIWADAQ